MNFANPGEIQSDTQVKPRNVGLRTTWVTSQKLPVMRTPTFPINVFFFGLFVNVSYSMWFFNAYSGLSLRFQVALIVAGGNPRPSALNDSPDIVTHIQNYFSHHIEKKDKFTSTPLYKL